MQSYNIKLSDGSRTRAVKFSLMGTVYWLLPQDARIAQNWDQASAGLGEDITRAAFIQRNAVRTDSVDGRKDVDPFEGLPFVPGDVVSLKSGGARFTVENASAGGLVDLIAAEFGAHFFRASLPFALVMAVQDKDQDIPF